MDIVQNRGLTGRSTDRHLLYMPINY